ncbi:MAG: hypothetical protein GY847_10575 [Proteobacteria bacterium]|nr:hypothetical protein [Pseudomonadota bacterium]
MLRFRALLLCAVWSMALYSASCKREKIATTESTQILKAAPEESTPENPSSWLTRAEASGFKATSNYSETLEFLRRLERKLPEMRLSFFGTTAEGRKMPVVVLSKDRAFTPKEARATGKPIIMIQSGIHAGEIDGKDACLMILRDLALGERRWILDATTLVIVPIYNIDGHERISPNNRPNQDGPLDGMGFRTTTAGMDLNRDHMKLVTPEARALIGLFNSWRPHLHVDDHVTDGSDHDWVLTHAWMEAPQVAPSIDAWLKEHMPRITAETEKMGHRNGPYVGLKERNDPSKGFSTTLKSPRLSTSYFALRNRPSILVETHSFKPFKARVLANRDFLIAMLKEIGRDPMGIVKAVLEADERTVELGRPDAPSSEITLSFKESDETDMISFPIYKWRLEPSLVSGKPLIRYERGVVDEIQVPWVHTVVAEKTLARPRGYLVLPGWPQIEQRLAGHGLQVEQLVEQIELEVETMRLSNPRFEKKSYQGEIRTEVDVSRRLERRTVPAGALWIPATQPDFEVAVQLLEPEAPDSLVSWGLMRSVLERKSFIGAQVLDKQVRELIKDPEIEKVWKEAIKDEKLANDPKARYVWWYRRTKHWDEQVGLLPAMRVMRLPKLATEPWQK